jgi:hypothetical protein
MIAPYQQRFIIDEPEDRDAGLYAYTHEVILNLNFDPGVEWIAQWKSVLSEMFDVDARCIYTADEWDERQEIIDELDALAERAYNDER